MNARNLINFSIIRNGIAIQLTANEINSLIKQYEKELYNERLEFIEEELADKFEAEDFASEEEREHALKQVAKEILGSVEDGFTTLADAINEWYLYFEEE